MPSGAPSGRDAESPGRDLARELAEFPDMNPGPVLRLDAEGHIEHVNRAARHVLGTTDVLQSCWRDICPGMTDEVWTAICTSDSPVVFEAEKEDECIQYTHVRRPDAGKIFVFGADVTALRRTERALEQKRAELAELARFPDMNPGPVLRVGLDGCIRLANRAANRVFDEPVLAGRTWTDICPTIDDAKWRQIAQATTDTIHEVKLGHRHLVFTHTPPTEAGNIFIYGADITEQKIAEHAMAQTEKMATLGTLSAGIAHEINNPAAAAVRASEHLRKALSELQASHVDLALLDLDSDERESLRSIERWIDERSPETPTMDTMARADNEEAVESWLESRGVDGFWDLSADLVEAGIGAPDLDSLCSSLPSGHLREVLTWVARSSTVYSLLDEVHHGAERISEIVGALREYSFLDQAPVQDVDVNRGIRNTLIILRNKFKKGIHVSEQLDDGLPRITAFGSQLNQVWTNLLDNAAAVLDTGGAVTVRSFHSDGGVTVEVEDDGPGIPPDIQNRIFDAFFTTKPLGQGTGLGLHTCYSIVVNRHGGSIKLESEPGRTCFRVWLPLTPARAESA